MFLFFIFSYKKVKKKIFFFCHLDFVGFEPITLDVKELQLVLGKAY